VLISDDHLTSPTLHHRSDQDQPERTGAALGFSPETFPGTIAMRAYSHTETVCSSMHRESAQPRRFKLYILNSEQTFFGYYPVREHPVQLVLQL
jgi:hypothetical protein